MMRTKFLSWLWIVILLLGMVGCSKNNTTASEIIRASGFIEGREYTLTSSLGGRVVEVLVEQGDRVEAGELLVALDATQLEDARDQTQAGVNAAQEGLAASQEKPTTREVAEAEAALKNAEGELDAAKASRDLLISSYSPLDPPAIELHAAESAIDVAEAGVELAKAQLAQVEAGPLEAEQKILEAQLNEAKANLRLIELQINELNLTAPIDGMVTQVLHTEGEVVSAGSPVLYLLDPDYLYLRLFIPVTQVAKVHIGDMFEITTDAYPDETFSGSVVHIADEAQFTPATVLTQEERVKLVFAVKLLVQDPSGKLKPGMPVDAASLP
jgi:HlyD family secretion protein